MNAKLSMENPDWYTPVAIVEAAREVMGGIDLDPASDAEANEVIKAARYFTEDDDALVEVAGDTAIMRAWPGRVFLNPPGGQVRRFWETLVMNFARDETTQAIWIGYSLEQFQSLQGANFQQLHETARRHPLQFPTCVPKARLKFEENEVKRQSRMAMERVKIHTRIQEIKAEIVSMEHVPFDGDTVARLAYENRLVTLQREHERLSKRKPRERAGSPTHGNYITYLGPNVERFEQVFGAFGVVVTP